MRLTFYNREALMLVVDGLTKEGIGFAVESYVNSLPIYSQPDHFIIIIPDNEANDE